MPFPSIPTSTTATGIADFLRSRHDKDTSDEDISNNKADFVNIMVDAVTVMTHQVVPPQSHTTSTMAAGRTISVSVVLPPLKKKRKYKSRSLMWANPIIRNTNHLTLFMSQWYIYYIQNAPS
jgi:hypothetical protein